MADQAGGVSTEGPAKHSNTLYNILTGSAILLGGFLLFQVQLIIAKYILPWFGGTPGVWTACLLFFQLVLLGGYGYSHALATRLGLKKQTLFHVSLLAASVLTLNALSFLWPSPITPGAAWKPEANAEPTLLIIQFLLVSVGLPFFLLSTTSPLLQHWFSIRNPGRSPYRFYSLSNLGSLLGLLSYPLLMEPNLPLQTQAWLWSCGYYVFAILCAIVAPWKFAALASAGHSPADTGGATDAPSREQQVFWVALAACGSAMLLATTNLISQQVAVSPFMWVAPLSLYLISFILCFDATAYRRELFHLIFVLTAFTTCGLMLSAVHAPLLYQLMSFLGVLFASFMVCHGELSLSKPPPRHLTRFYLCMAAGGALGGVFVSVLAPRIFSGLWEFPLGIVATMLLLLVAVRRDSSSWWRQPFYWMPLTLMGAILLLVPAAAEALKIETLLPSNLFYVLMAGVLIVAAVGVQVWQSHRISAGSNSGITRTSAFLAVVVLAGGFLLEARMRLKDSVARARNFYGVLAVVRGTSLAGDYLFLRDRMVDHGMQFADPKLARTPVGYYGGYSGIKIFMQQLPATPVRVGVVGLGTGNLATFSRPGDVYRLYEINPAVIRFADGPGAYFTYLRDARGTVELAFGDARLSLEREAARGQHQKFDVLILDAFSGDAVPVHILTREAFELYLQHLRSKDSVIAVHITNRHLDLSQVLARVASEFGFAAVRIHRPWFGTFSAQTDWVLFSRNPASLSNTDLKMAGTASKLPAEPTTPIWTDDYSNLLKVLR